MTRLRLTTAGRLLAMLAKDGLTDLNELARQLRLPVRHLEECRDGQRTLELEDQMRLASLVLLLAPQQRRLAHTLYAQAQTALRVRAGADQVHPTYPRATFR